VGTRSVISKLFLAPNIAVFGWISLVSSTTLRLVNTPFSTQKRFSPQKTPISTDFWDRSPTKPAKNAAKNECADVTWRHFALDHKS